MIVYHPALRIGWIRFVNQFKNSVNDWNKYIGIQFYNIINHFSFSAQIKLI